MWPTIRLPPEEFEALQSYLVNLGFAFEERPHQVFLARKGKAAVVNLYSSGKVVLGGSDSKLIEEVLRYLESRGGTKVEKEEKELPPLDLPYPHIGTDEVGKGDYFGPLIVAGVLATAEAAAELERIGVKDSKLLSDTTVANKASQIRSILGPKRYRIVHVPPVRYNVLIRKMRNLNRLLGWAHARAIEDLLAGDEGCGLAVADQFGDPAYIRDSLMARGRRIELRQTPKAERDVAVAAASILARDSFLRKLEELSEAYGARFPKGASNVVEFGKKLVDEHGMQILTNVAKLHFATTEKITGGTIPEIPQEIAGQVSEARPPRRVPEAVKEDERLEVYNLISAFEVELRALIERALSARFGASWWEDRIDAGVRGKAERLAQAEAKRGRSARPVDCLDFAHYEMILLDDKNWEEAFRPVFQNKDQLRARLVVLKSYRDPVAHTRGEITTNEKGEVVGAIHWIRKMIRGQSRVEDFHNPG